MIIQKMKNDKFAHVNEGNELIELRGEKWNQKNEKQLEHEDGINMV